MELHKAIEILRDVSCDFASEKGPGCSYKRAEEALDTILDLLDPVKAEGHAKVLSDMAEERETIIRSKTHKAFFSGTQEQFDIELAAWKAGAAALSLVPKLEERVRMLKEAHDSIHDDVLCADANILNNDQINYVLDIINSREALEGANNGV